MREIKFRVWVEAPDGEVGMHYPKLVSFGSGQLSWATLQDDLVLKDNGWYTRREVMQYTGLKDKNGVEIYEGDIVLSDGYQKDVVEYGIQEVDAFEGYGWNLWSFYDDDGKGYKANGMRLSSTYEVIGNIYENPELLKD